MRNHLHNERRRQITLNRRGLLPHEAALASASLRDRALMPRLQKVLDRLVPTHLTEAQFWDNFFSHVDVLKVKLVTEYLTAQDVSTTHRARKHDEWLRLYDSLEPEMRDDLRRAAERIAARQQPPAPSAVELQYGLDARRSPRWQPDGEAWLEYVEDGPHEVQKVSRAPHPKPKPKPKPDRNVEDGPHEVQKVESPTLTLTLTLTSRTGLMRSRR